MQSGFSRMRKLAFVVTCVITIASVGLAAPITVGSADCPDLAAAVAAASGRTIVIETPQVVAQSLTFPADSDVVFQDRGRLIRGADSETVVKIAFEGGISAPMRTIFEGFSPGEVTVSPWHAREVYPQWWGAVGDGTADDTVALQSAISGASHIYIPKGKYRITKALDATNKRDGFHLIGQSYFEGRGAEIVGETGGIVLDLTGANVTHLEDLYITQGRTNPSTVGLLYARSDVWSAAEPNTLERVRVDFRSVPEANGGHGSVALYNVASEGWSANRCFFAADVPAVFAATNIYKIFSPYTGAGTTASMSGASMFHCYFHAFRGPAIRLSSPSDIEFENCDIFAVDDPNVPEANRTDTTQWAIEIDGNYAQNVRFHGHVEQWYKLLHIGTVLRGCEFTASMTGMIGPESTPFIFVDGSGWDPAGMHHCSVNIRGVVRPDPPYVYLKASGEKLGGIIGSTFHIHPGQTIEIDGGAFQGNAIYSSDPDPQVTINASEGEPSYVLYSPRGIDIVGPGMR